MTVTNVHKDTERLTMTVTSEFEVPVERAWLLWSDPRQLERWWGPPTYPATVVEHDLNPGGRVSYFMTGPEGDKHQGYWQVLEADPPKRFVIEDGFADENGIPSTKMPTMIMTVELTSTELGTTMTINTAFPSLEAMEQLIKMGMEEGLRLALGQIDGILAG